jgi:hypothetical protein
VLDAALVADIDDVSLRRESLLYTRRLIDLPD